MNSEPQILKTKPQKRNFRSGYTMTDLVVGATLLIGLMSFVAPLSVRTGRLWQDSRHYRLALDELSNQLELLTRLDETERVAALENLSVSPQVSSRLPNPVLHAKTIEDEDGTRLVLQLQWDRIGPAGPVTLVAWIDPMSSESSTGSATLEEIEP